MALKRVAGLVRQQALTLAYNDVLLIMAVAFFCALAWGTLRARTSSLVPTLVAHLLWDVLVLLWLPLDIK